MAKQVITRRASDNEYLHKGFHGALSCGIDYLEQTFGPGAVREYLYEFARVFYAPLTADLRRRGLIALREHFEKLYRIEGGQIRIRLRDDEMTLEVSACPAVRYMRTHGQPVARLFHETTKTVNEAICEAAGFTAELVEYDAETGRSVQRFVRKAR